MPVLPLWIAAAVVVELFTSQGCSSCPPADALISEVQKTRADVIPLAYHVDYWDNAFWHDPFSSRQWTQRQMMYVRAFALNSAYTPQMVVNGATQFVGSNAAALRSAIENAKKTAPVAFEATRKGANIVANVHTQPPPNSDIVFIVFENGIRTAIQGGENMGRTAIDDAIVRKMWRVHSAGPVTIPISEAWKKIGVAVLVQDRTTLAITAAAARAIE